jgi:hypothetical protein
MRERSAILRARLNPARIARIEGTKPNVTAVTHSAQDRVPRKLLPSLTLPRSLRRYLNFPEFFE